MQETAQGTNSEQREESSVPFSVYGYRYGAHFHTHLSVILFSLIAEEDKSALSLLQEPFAKLQQCSASLIHPPPSATISSTTPNPPAPREE